MKNLKRALSLVLSTAMLAGMMMVGTGAAFDDVTAEHNEEAIAVVSAAGIMGANEEFNPDAKITRNEMAVVMCNMLDLNTEDYAGASNFADVPAWAEGYVDACYAEGIVSGVSATQYNGSANVTTGEAALMMMKALGYFQFASDFENDWLLATIKQASKIDLLDDVNAGAKAAMTRNEVAQLALNTLEATMVEGHQSGTTGTITSGDVSVELNAQVNYYDLKAKKNYDYNKDGEGTLELIEELYGNDFTKTGYTTDLEQPGHIWKDNTQKTDDQKIIAVADDAKYTVVIDKKGLTNAWDVYKEYVDKDIKNDSDVFAYATQYTYDADGKVTESKKVRDVDFALNGTETTDKALTYNIGDVVEFYTNDDNRVTDVVNIRYSIGEISKITSKGLTSTEKEDGATARVTIKNVAKITDDKFAGFDYEEGDIILYVLNSGETKVLASELAATIEGKVTGVKSGATAKAKIDGEYYIDLTNTEVGDEGTFYLGKADQIMYTDTTSASEDYIYIYALDVDTEGKNADGIDTTVATAYTVNAEGTKAKYDLAIDVVTAVSAKDDELKRSAGLYFADKKDLIQWTDDKGNKVNYTGVIAYSVNSDDQLVKENAKDEIDPVATLTVDKDGAAGTSSATEFIFAQIGKSSVKVSTATGYKNVNFSGKAWTVTNKDGDILYVFADAKNGSVSVDANLAVILDTAYDLGENEDGDKTYTYTVAINGEESALTFEKPVESVVDGQVIAYEFDGSWAVIDTDVTVYHKNVITANDDYLVLNAKDEKTGELKDIQFNLTGDETLYTVTKVYDYDGAATPAESDLDYVMVTEGADIEGKSTDENGKPVAGSEAYYVIDGDAIDTLFVVEKTW